MFSDLLVIIEQSSHLDFGDATKLTINFIDSCNKDNFIDIIKQIGTIPESINHDSTEEKLFAKISDAVLSRAFREIGLKSRVLIERADAADVIAESPIHGYTLVADAKAFRMSRTAKNQKDFKVVSLSSWRNDADYAVLCSPYFQYPLTMSQIYAQSINHNVCLLSWEHLIFMIEHGIKESVSINLTQVWDFTEYYSQVCTCNNMKKCYFEDFNARFTEIIGLTLEGYIQFIQKQIEVLKARAGLEKVFWNHEIDIIKNYTKEQAIEELISCKKIREKIIRIDAYIGGLRI
ncbi:MAG: HindIII family type II restriction endonuclease [Clostridiales bacterium]|nr:HindIII family type II restriction endonuclease [Clostridiales bacterium]